MIAEAGLAALWLAAAFCALQLALAAIGLHRERDDLIAAVRPVAAVGALLTLASLLMLIWLFVRADMSVELVFTDSHAAKPPLYRALDTWGNGGGLLLMGVAVLANAGAAVALFERQMKRPMHAATLGAQALIGLCCYAYLLLATNPFTRVTSTAQAGLGLNPLVQNPFVALHLLALLIGFATLAIAFCLMAGASIADRSGADGNTVVRRWLLTGWIFLTLALVAGSYAEEVGRWGYASLVAWLATTTLLHGSLWAKSRPRRSIRLRMLVWGRKPRRAPLFAYGMILAHLGFAVSLPGIAANGFNRETAAAARFGDIFSVGPFRIKFMGIRPVAGPGWSALEGEFRAVRGGPPMRLLPQTRFFADPPVSIGERAIRTLWDGRLVAALGARDGDSWQIRLEWKPFVTLIWLGGVLMALGGVLVLISQLRRERAAALRNSWL